MAESDGVVVDQMAEASKTKLFHTVHDDRSADPEHGRRPDNGQRLEEPRHAAHDPATQTTGQAEITVLGHIKPYIIHLYNQRDGAIDRDRDDHGGGGQSACLHPEI